MPRPMFPWLAADAPPEPPNRWIAPTPEVVIARPKTNVRDTAHAARMARKPKGGGDHAVKEPTQPAVKSAPLEPEPTTTDDLDVKGTDPDSNQGRDESAAAAVEVSPVAATRSDLLSPAMAMLVRRDTTPDDLRLDQSLPPMFRVVGLNGETIAEFNGCEHATHANHVWPNTRGVIRIADGKRMTERRG